MRRLAAISVLLALALSCVEKNPSWNVHWDDPGYGDSENPSQQQGDGGEDSGQEPDTPSVDAELCGSFTESFGSAAPERFLFRRREGRPDFRCLSAFPSLSELSTDILLLRLDPEDPSGTKNGPRLTADSLSMYGSYAIRIRMPDLSRFKSKTDAVFDFGLEGADIRGNYTRILLQWKLADPTALHLEAAGGTASSPASTKLDVKMAEVFSKDFDFSSAFHICGFDWKPDSVEWWVEDSASKARKTIGKTADKSFVPKAPAFISAGAFHSSNAPKYPFEIEIDSISYSRQ